MTEQYNTYETWSPDMKNRCLSLYKLDPTHKTETYYQDCLKLLSKHRNKVKPLDFNDAEIYDKCYGDHWPTSDLDPQPLRKEKREPHIIDDLSYQLQNSRFHLSECKKRMNLLRNQIVLCKELLSRETGDDVKEVSLPDLLRMSKYPRWKERVQKIRNLKAHVNVLEYKLQMTRRLVQREEVAEDGEITAKAEKVMHRQKRLLRVQYSKQKFHFEETEERSALVKKYEELSLMYKASLARNKMLNDELISFNRELNRMKQKEKNDTDLIASLMLHQRHLKDILDQERYLCDSTIKHEYNRVQDMHHDRMEDVSLLHEVREALEAGQEGRRECLEDPASMKLECEKYKTLLESTMDEKDTLDHMVDVLSTRLDEVSQQVEEAQRHCEEQYAETERLRQQLEALKASGKAIPKATEMVDKSVRGSMLQEQLRLIQEENQYLRSFLQKAIMTKEDDFRVYQSTMEGAKQYYLRSLEEIKTRMEEPKLTMSEESISGLSSPPSP